MPCMLLSSGVVCSCNFWRRSQRSLDSLGQLPDSKIHSHHHRIAARPKYSFHTEHSWTNSTLQEGANLHLAWRQVQNGVWLHLQTSCSQVHKPSPQYAITQASLKPRYESLYDHTGWILTPAYRSYMPHIRQKPHSVHRSMAMLVSMLTGAAIQMTACAVTILSTLVQILAASAITIVTPLAVTMHLADVHAWQCYTRVVQRS